MKYNLGIKKGRSTRSKKRVSVSFDNIAFLMSVILNLSFGFKVMVHETIFNEDLSMHQTTLLHKKNLQHVGLKIVQRAMLQDIDF